MLFCLSRFLKVTFFAGEFCRSVNDARIVRGAILSLCCEVRTLVCLLLFLIFLEMFFFRKTVTQHFQCRKVTRFSLSSLQKNSVPLEKVENIL